VSSMDRQTVHSDSSGRHGKDEISRARRSQASESQRCRAFTGAGRQQSAAGDHVDQVTGCGASESGGGGVGQPDLAQDRAPVSLGDEHEVADPGQPPALARRRGRQRDGEAESPGRGGPSDPGSAGGSEQCGFDDVAAYARRGTHQHVCFIDNLIGARPTRDPRLSP